MMAELSDEALYIQSEMTAGASDTSLGGTGAQQKAMPNR